MKFKSLRTQIMFFSGLISLSVIFLVGFNYSLVNSLNKHNGNLKQISASLSLVKEMKEAFKAKQADAGWFLAKSGDLADQANILQEYSTHGEEVLDAEKQLIEKSKTLLSEEGFKTLDENNKNLDDAFLNGISKSQNLSTSIKTFDDSIDKEDTMTDGWMEALEKQNADTEKTVATYEKSVLSTILVFGIVIILITTTLGVGFSLNIIKAIRYISDKLKQISHGDLNITIDVKHKNELGELETSAQKMVTDLKAMIKFISTTSDFILESVEQTSANSREIQNETEQFAEKIQSMATNTNEQFSLAHKAKQASNELHVAIDAINNRTKILTENSNTALEVAESGNLLIIQAINNMKSINDQVSKSTTMMKNLEKTSKEIDNIVLTIAKISSQTNLLALNAAIESARAGEEGKGFSIVAHEIGKLAEESAKSAKSITDLIKKTQLETQNVSNGMLEEKKEVEQGMLVIERTGDYFKKILDTYGAVSHQIRAIAANNKNISSHSEAFIPIMNQLEVSSNLISELTSNASALSQEENSIASEISNNASRSADIARQLKSLVSKFKVD